MCASGRTFEGVRKSVLGCARVGARLRVRESVLACARVGARLRGVRKSVLACARVGARRGNEGRASRCAHFVYKMRAQITFSSPATVTLN